MRHILHTLFCQHLTLEEYFKHRNIVVNEKTKSVSKNLCKKVVVCASHGGKIFPACVSTLKKEFSTEEVVHHAIEHLLKCGKVQNILTSGYRFISERYPNSCIKGTIHVRMTSFNSIVMYLKSKCWEAIHEQLGDDLFFHVLTSTYIFLSIPNKCYVQLTGVPVSEVPHLQCQCRYEKKKEKILSSFIASKTKTSLENTNGKEIIKTRKPVKRKSNSTIYRSKKRLKLSDERFNEPLQFDKIKKPSKRKFLLQKNYPRTQNVTYIRRSKMFYSTLSHDIISKNYILNRVNSSNSGVYTILSSIYQFNNSKHRLPKYLLPLGKIMKLFIQRFKRFRFKYYLNLYCPIPKWFVAGKTSKMRHAEGYLKKMRFNVAVKSYVPVQKVFLFLRYIIKDILRDFFVGCEKNFNQFASGLKRIIFLGRYEKISIEKLVAGMKMSQFDWLSSFHSYKKCLQQTERDKEVVKLVFLWLYNDCIIPLLRAFFFITETSCHRNTVFYYRKPVWNVILREGLQSVIGCVYKPISKSAVKEKLKNNACLGVYDIRLIPGQNKIRPIANMSKCCQGPKSDKKVYLNHILKPVHLCLRYEVQNKPLCLGATVTNSNMVYKRWIDYKVYLKQNYETPPNLYFVSLDISRCFDTLPQNQLMKLVQPLFKGRSYIIRKLIKVQLNSNGDVSKRHMQMVSDGYDCDNFIQFISKKQRTKEINCKNTIFVDKVFTVTVSRDQLLKLLVKHISCSIGRMKEKYFLQDEGVPQGSILASLLNNIHYGNIEQTDLNQYLHSKESLLMRWVDDYLFTTTSKTTATEFISSVNKVMSLHGCVLNVKKTLVNFEHVVEGRALRCIHGDLINWCGYLINTRTMGFHFNYLQYIGDNIRESMTLEYSKHPALSMTRKLQQAVSVKASPLILDDLLNTNDNIQLNIYQAFRFIALKFQVHFRALSKDRTFEHRIGFYMDMIHNLIYRFYTSSRNNFSKVLRNRYADENNSDNSESYRSSVSGKSRAKLNENLIHYLCVQAFLDSLRPKRSAYSILVSRLVNDIKTLKDYDDVVDIQAIRNECAYFDMIKTS